MKVKRFLEFVSLPSQTEVETKLFHHLKSFTRPVEAATFYDLLAEDFNLSLAQRGVGPRNDPCWHYLVRQAKRRLVDEGLVRKPLDGRPGPWILTSTGRNTPHWPTATTLADLGLDV